MKSNVLKFVIVGLCMTGLCLSGGASVRPRSGGYSTDHGTLAPYTPPSSIDGTGKKLLAIYLVGSDLESNDQAGTTDFNELIQGAQSGSTANVDVIIAFGGADKDGWRGMKFTTLNQLAADGQDGQYGDETGANAYQYVENRAHMGDQSSLIHFLKFINDGYKNYDQRFLVLWDHGGSYMGFGNDENYNYDPLTLTEIDTALAQSQTGIWDAIGFDACLMASVEVANCVKTHSRYLIASEELEPGHGWNWTAVIQKYASESSIEQSVIAIVDNYVQNVHDYDSDGKTLSIVDLGVVDDLLSRLDAVAMTFAYVISADTADKQVVIDASTKAQVYGQQSKEDQRVSLDLKHVAELALAKVTDPTLSSQLSELIQALGQFIVHAREDGTRPNSNGISVIAPENDPSEVYPYGTSGMESFQNAYKNLQLSDTTAPEIVDQETDVDADNLEWGELSYSDLALMGTDPAFFDWQLILDDELWYQYLDGWITEDEYWALSDEIYTRTEDDPEYQQWLVEVIEDPDALAYLFFVPQSVIDFFSAGLHHLDPIAELDDYYYGSNDELTAKTLSNRLSLPFMNGERAAFVAVDPNAQSGNVRPNGLTNPSGVTGLLATFDDPNLVEVSTMFGNILTFDVDDDGNIDDWFFAIAGVEAYPTTTPGQYFTPKWNRYWYYMDFGFDADAIYIPMFYDYKIKILGHIFTIYYSEVDYRDAEIDYSSGSFETDPYGEPVDYATIEFLVSENNFIIDNTVKPYKLLYSDDDDEWGTSQYDKSTKKLKPYDQVRFYEQGINLTREGYDFWFEASDMVTMEYEPEFFIDVLEFVDENEQDLAYYYSMIAEDIAGNTVMTDPALTDKPGGSTAVSDWSLY